ncbi:hypothetical protein SAMN05444483_101564 [Salegentibacter echinorum]|uniref:Por secretion system C-terminal sorting domain-containing protein n=2 Tax=Salegentibacter echinorum TaxID=1073325 RepID=A0A1M5CKJ1_SALEC|nr:hypothetical protein SAMN05444483_101564 [Salegentibacter echinorum]
MYIAPTSTQDSFIYLNDRFLYIEGAIELKKNNPGNTEASIYLRKGSQLLQGDKNSNLNSGNGWLSVFQEGTSNAFDYNYWAMPVLDNISTNQSFGAVIFEPETVTKSKTAQITSNLEGSANPLEISSRWIYKYSGLGYNAWQHVGKIFDLSPGEGFSMKGVNGTNSNSINGVENNPGNKQRYDFRGLPNDGEIRLPIKKEENILVGNPYPSALHLRSFLLENPASTGIAYFWDSKSQGNSHNLKDYEGGYGSYSPGANAYVPAVFKTYTGAGEENGDTGASGANIAREYSPIAQGFMLEGKSNGYIYFKNSQRRFQKENVQNSQFKSQPKADPSLFYFHINFNDLYVRPLLLTFAEDASVAADWAMDAQIYGFLNNDAGWNIEEAAYNIQVRPFRKNDKIPLLLHLEEDTKIDIKLKSSNSSTPVFVFDAEKNEYYDVKKASFLQNLTKGFYNDRFFISFMEENEEVSFPIDLESELIEPNSSEFAIVQGTEQTFLSIKMKQKVLKKIILFDLNGKMIVSQEVKTKSPVYNFNTLGLQNSVYIIKMLCESGEVFTSKITIRN